MKVMKKLGACSLGLAASFLFSSCGMVTYPGQPGIVTHNYSKIDLEFLDASYGLWVYETVYDNRPGGKGVAAIITKLYPGASTYTTNVRTNADGTLYRVKGNYEGAEVQMISIPTVNQIHIHPHSKVALSIGYETSLDEIDDVNIAEANLFSPASGTLSLGAEALGLKKLRWDILKAGDLRSNGNLSYEVTSLDLGAHTFKPSKPVVIQTNLLQNAVHTDVSTDVRTEAAQFIETHFPKGFSGSVKLNLKGASKPLSVKMTINTLKTAKASGATVIRDASPELATDILKRFKATP